MGPRLRGDDEMVGRLNRGQCPWHRRPMVVPKQARRGPPPVTAERLEASALYYLQRFASSAENLRRVLERRVDRSARQHGTDRAAGRALVDALVQRLQAAGLLDDRFYAEAKAASL